MTPCSDDIDRGRLPGPSALARAGAVPPRAVAGPPGGRSRAAPAPGGGRQAAPWRATGALLAVVAAAVLAAVGAHGGVAARSPGARARDLAIAQVVHHPPAWPVADPGRWVVAGREIVRYRAGAGGAIVARVRAHGGLVVQRLPELDTLVVSPRAGRRSRVLRAAIASSAGVAAIEPDVRLQLLDADCAVVAGCAIPDDPGFPRQWYLNNGRRTIEPPGGGAPGADVDAPLGWSIESGSDAVKIAIIDTGIDPAQADVAPRIVSDQSLAADQGDAADASGHGTAVAGIAAAIPNNGAGIAGVAYRAGIVNIKVVTDSHPRSVDCTAVAAAIVAAANAQARVINVSAGSPMPCALEAQAVAYAWTHGDVIVAAAGNGGNGQPIYPAAYDDVIAVGATDAFDRAAPFSSRGAAWVDLAAPGVGIFTTLPTYANSYGRRDLGYVSGTSFAAPMVSGAAALLFAQGLDNEQVAGRLLGTARAVAGSDSDWRYGLLDVCEALADGGPRCPPVAQGSRR